MSTKPPKDVSPHPRKLRLVGNTKTAIKSLGFGVSHRSLIASLGDGSVIEWRPAPPFTDDAGKKQILQRHKGSCLAFVSPNDQYFITCGTDGILSIASTGDKRNVAPLGQHGKAIKCGAFTADSRFFVSGGNDSKLMMWELASRSHVRTMTGHDGPITDVAFCGNDYALISASVDSFLRVWDAESGECLWVMSGHSDVVTSLTVSPHGGVAVSASLDGTVRVWSVETGKCYNVHQDHDSDVSKVQFHPKATCVVSASTDGSLCVIDTLTWTTIHRLKGVGGPSPIKDFAFSSDGTVLACCREDGVLCIWDLDRGELLSHLLGHAVSATTIAFAPDDTLLASGDKEGIVVVWDLTPVLLTFQQQKDSERCCIQ